jgi:hypothetical protein
MPEIVDSEEIEEIGFAPATIVPRPNRHYIDDDHLTAILSDWKAVFDYNKANGLERPRLPEPVGEAIYDMSEAMGKRHNFSGYSYLDEMKSDAILHCIKYIHNFNPKVISEKKGKVSAFGYINMIIWHTFGHRIKFEKHQQYLKYASFEQMGGMEAFQDEEMVVANGDGDDAGGMSVSALGADFIQKAREYEEEYLKAKVKKEKVIEFDNFMFDLAEPEQDEVGFEIEFE